MNIFICNLPARLKKPKFLNPFSRKVESFLVKSFRFGPEHDVAINTRVSFKGERDVTILCTQAEEIFKGKEVDIGCQLVRIMDDVCDEERMRPPDSFLVVEYLN